ncbi:MAG: hypothetical protein KDA84_11905, partial [Planctomycetaceae bacterium]|nr:hypothetical protein [Planctomycetaceae bacterium]
MNPLHIIFFFFVGTFAVLTASAAGRDNPNPNKAEKEAITTLQALGDDVRVRYDNGKPHRPVLSVSITFPTKVTNADLALLQGLP